MMRAVFVYGTLMFPEIAAAVAGRPLAATAATLRDYARFRVSDAPYPGIAPSGGASVAGLVFPDVDPTALERLDTFEGEMYRREAVQVLSADAAEPIDAETYVIRPRWRPLLADRPWDPDTFARQWHETYMRNLRAGQWVGGAG